MIALRLHHLGRAAVLLLGLALPSSPVSADTTTAQTGQVNCVYGKLSGSFNLPVGQVGSVQGLLRAPDGTPLFAVQAKTAPDPSTLAIDGFVDGTLYRLQGPNAPVPVATVKGRWALLPNGVGRVQMAFLQSGPLGFPQVFGAAQAVFADPPNPEVAGQLKGKWAVCP